MEIPEVSTYDHLPVEGVDPVRPDALLVSICNYQGLGRGGGGLGNVISGFAEELLLI